MSDILKDKKSNPKHLRQNNTKSNNKSERNITFNNYDHVFHHVFRNNSKLIGCYNTVDGFSSIGCIYYAVLEIKIFGIKLQTIIVRCKSESEMYSWIDTMRSGNINSRIANSWYICGNEIEMHYTFKTKNNKSNTYNIVNEFDYFIKEEFIN